MSRAVGKQGLGRHLAVALAGAVVGGVAACSGGEGAAGGQTRTVSRADLGQSWPLTVESGALACTGGAITIDVGGTKYAVNGTAKSTGALDITPVWAPNPNVAGLRKNIAPLIDEGQKLCR